MITKILIAFIVSIMFAFKPVSSIYDISIQKLDGSSIDLNSFNGKKIVVVEFDPVNYNEPQLRTLDTLQRADTTMQVIAVPAKDFGSSIDAEDVQNIVSSLDLSFIVTAPAFVKRIAGTDQQNLFNWLTHVDENSHFDNDADEAGQIYLINKEGTLYAMLDKGTSNSLIKELLSGETN